MRMSCRADAFERYLMGWVRKLLRGEQAQDLAEYAILSSFIALIAIVALAAVGNSIAVIWGNIIAAFSALP